MMRTICAVAELLVACVLCKSAGFCLQMSFMLLARWRNVSCSETVASCVYRKSFGPSVKTSAKVTRYAWKD